MSYMKKYGSDSTSVITVFTPSIWLKGGAQFSTYKSEKNEFTELLPKIYLVYVSVWQLTKNPVSIDMGF